ncbi:MULTISPECIES: IS110 family transposase [unclassified Dysgonomonas]|uniref:IS110 family transposase n=1 Tax=unclassified Dysgonomonas TaxID=2630389 RepID=UPI0025C2BB4D|nr:MULTISPECIES: IS110 family transposase [unclassified Dysgonomonas]HMM02729.1 IS110 family transposase [Dysgonomonas sp.]
MEKQAFIGVDISKLTLDICLYDSEKYLLENYLTISNDSKGFSHFLKWLKSEHFKTNTIAVCMEHTGVYGLEFSRFLESSGIDFMFVPGHEIKYSCGLRRGKSDKIDARAISRYCYEKRDRHVYDKPKTAYRLRLQELLTERRAYVKERKRIKTYLTEHKNAVNASTGRYTRQLEQISILVKEVETDLLELIRSDEETFNNYNLLTTVVGISLVNAANILLHTDNFKAFDNPRDYACYCGVAPFGKQSGTSIKRADKVSQMANKQLKADLSQSALAAVRHDPELRLYFERKRASGKHRNNVLNAIKFKLIQRMFATVKRGSPYVKLGGYSTPKQSLNHSINHQTINSYENQN